MEQIKSLIRKKSKSGVWICPCGCIVAKRGAVLAGWPSGGRGFHVHCPECGKTVAQFVKPSEVK